MVIYLILLAASALCFVYGLIRYIGKKVPLFCVLVTASLGCFMMGHLCETLSLLLSGSIPEHFHIGMLARVGGFAFLCSASFAQMDGLVDDKSASIRKYRMIALLAPAAVLLLYVPVLLSDVSVVRKITGAVIILFIAFPSYYHLKHLIIPDVSMGIIVSIRGYSLAALILELSWAVLMTAERMEVMTVGVIAGIVLAVSYPCVWLAMEKGRKQWTI